MSYKHYANHMSNGYAKLGESQGNDKASSTRVHSEQYYLAIVPYMT